MLLWNGIHSGEQQTANESIRIHNAGPLNLEKANKPSLIHFFKKELVGGQLILGPGHEESVKYFSGIAHLEIFDKTTHPKRVAYLTKQFKNMRFDLDRAEAVGVWTENPDRSYFAAPHMQLMGRSVVTVIDLDQAL